MKSVYELQIFDISSDDIDKVFVITIYGKTTDNKDIIVHITDFKPFFYIKIPELFCFHMAILKPLKIA